MHSNLILFFFIFFVLQLTAQPALVEKLGYGPEDKLLIIHADDLGVAHSENKASILAMKVGMVNSASIMMPCPWVSEVADFAKENPGADLGLHLTLTSEWQHLKWGPIAPKGQVESLLDSLGFFYDNCLDFGKYAKVEEAEIELRAQIEQAIKMGIKPTHLDTHMGCLIFNSPELFEVYLKLGREYKMPVLLGRFFLQAASPAFLEKITSADIILEKVMTASPDDYKTGLSAYYENTLKNISPGINILLVHLAFNDAEMQALSINHPLWGAAWRQQDFDFFTSEKCRQVLKEENIKLITWRQIQATIQE
ncbi:MAG: polysaccharide deacetylase family protein [Bacteroidota bacterium]